ncbi:BglII/BstYI family type II restriction endonuclease [Megalodesulfovibrio paquesii]
MFERLASAGYECLLVSHARAILAGDFPAAVAEIEHALEAFRIPVTELIGSGGGEAGSTQRLRRALNTLGWEKRRVEIKKIVNGVERESISHEIDHMKSFQVEDRAASIALEIEWNNKDPFFDRDLENFKRLHAEGAISVGVIITRGSSLQDQLIPLVQRFVADCGIHTFEDLTPYGISPTPRQREHVLRSMARGRPFAESWPAQFVSDKYGAATTHWKKLIDRVHRGVGNPCPLALIGLPATIISSAPHGPAEAEASGQET